MSDASRARVLAIEHEPGAGPEMFGLWLSDHGVQVDVCKPYAGEVLPGRIEHGGLMVLGGSMGACDDDDAPWLPRVRTLLGEATAVGRPVLGICLGAEMLAVALGGHVEPSRAGGELGLHRIDLNEESRKDPLFAGMSSPAEAAQWHDDEITELPSRAVLLASSATCRVQAFRMSERSWGVQFHPEASGAVMQAWADGESALAPARLRAVELAIEEVAEAEDRLFEQWQGFAERFARIVKEG